MTERPGERLIKENPYGRNDGMNRIFRLSGAPVRVSEMVVNVDFQLQIYGRDWDVLDDATDGFLLRFHQPPNQGSVIQAFYCIRAPQEKKLAEAEPVDYDSDFMKEPVDYDSDFMKELKGL